MPAIQHLPSDLFLPPDLLLALIGFAFVTSITPGPNNLMLLASGVNYGFRRTIPHMLGIGIGFTIMVVLVGLGLGRVFEAVPALYGILKYLGAAYMLWLAYGVARSGPVGEGKNAGNGKSARNGKSAGQPMSFIGAALFQWVNPKAWAMALSATATYTVAGNFVGSVLVIALIFGLVNLPTVSIWALFGTAMRRYLSDPVTVRTFNVTMALLLVASLWPIVADLL
jgi:threonine/homoserine/homoserine lactone efflux protein